MNLLIREYTTNDYVDLATITDDTWAVQIITLAADLKKNYDGKIIKLLLAYNNNELIGFIYGFILPNRTLIPEFMYVIPQYRNHGIAHRLLNSLEKKSGCTSSMIFYNKELHDFYQKQGYLSGDRLETAMKFL